jgi:hypothetical protein
MAIAALAGMQMYDAIVLQEAWKKKGNPPCKHPVVDREYSLGAHTGEMVCTTCGAYVTPDAAGSDQMPKF